MQRCPGCRARLGADPVCSRCGCDLSLVVCVEIRAESYMRSAVRAWTAGDHDVASLWIQKSLALVHSPLGELLAECLHRPGSSCRSSIAPLEKVFLARR